MSYLQAEADMQKKYDELVPEKGEKVIVIRDEAGQLYVMKDE